MAILKAKKIFVDTKDEVTFITESILTASEEQVILVVPQNSQIFSSQTSLNVLFRLGSQAKKLLIFVTEDPQGAKYIQHEGFVVVGKVSQITNDLWEVVKNRRDAMLRELDKKRKLLNGTIEESDAKQVDTESEHENGKEKFQPESVPDKTKEEPLGNALGQNIKKEGPKVVSISGIDIVAGGDVSSYLNDQSNDKISDDFEEEVDNLANNSENMDGAGTFAGRDLTRAISKKKNFGGVFKKIGFNKGIASERDPNKALMSGSDGFRRGPNKRVVAIAAIFVGLVLVLLYFVIFKSARVDLRLNLKEESIAASQQVKANTTTKQIDLENLVMPALLIEEKDLSSSKTGEASGQGQTGNKAKGLVTISNKTDKAVKLVAGTKITSIVTNLNYFITKDVSLEANTIGGGGGVNTASIAYDVPVEAEKFGEQYNATDSGSNTVFTIAGYNQVDVDASRTTPFEGGTSQTFIAVSKENVDAVKKTMLPELEAQGTQLIRTDIPKGYKLLDGTIVFKEGKVTSLPAVGAKATDKTFSLTVEGTITALAVNEDDLTTMVNYIVTKANSSGADGETAPQASIDNIDITSVVRKDNEATFLLSTKGQVKKGVVIDQIIKDVSGKSIPKAREILDANENIQSYKIIYTPFFVPGFLRIIPSDVSRITITTE